MGLPNVITNLLKTIVPQSHWVAGGTHICYAPYAAPPITLTGHGTGWMAWTNVVQILPATGNLTDLWIEAVELSMCTVAGSFVVALGYLPVATGAPGIPTDLNNGLEGMVCGYLGLGGANNVGPAARICPCNPPIHIPGGNLVSASVASDLATGVVDVRIIYSRNKT